MAARLRGPSSTTCRGRVLSRSQVRPRHAAPSGSTQRGGDKETGCRRRHRKQVLCGGRATLSLERWGVRQIPRAEVRWVRGRRQAEVRGAQTQPAPSAHCSSLLTGGLLGKSRPREDRATHRGGPWLQRVSSAGTTKGHGVTCLRGPRLSVGKLGKRSVHKKTPGVPSSARVLSRGPGPRARPGSWQVWRAGKGAERVGRLEEIGALAELQK